MFTEIRLQREALEGVLAALDPERLDGLAAVRVLRELARLEHVVAHAKGRVARRVDRSKVWERRGNKSAAHLVARVTGTSVGAAATVLDTAQHLESLPVTEQAYLEGRLSPVQAESELVDAAKDVPFASLRERAQRVKARGVDLLERDRRIHAARQVRQWTDGEGAWNLSARGTITDGARVMAALKAEADTVFTEARAAGRREPMEAYAFDALVRLATRDPGDTKGGSGGPKAHVHVNVDAGPLLELQGLPGTTCEIPGLGPIPVADARRLLGDALVTVIIKKGVDVTTIAHHGRTTPTAIRRAAEARDPECVVEGCPCRDQLDIHHLVDWAKSLTTTLAGVVRICPWHHYLVTHCDYTLEPIGDGVYRLVAPDDPDPP
jgi:hypothetical protein